MIDEDGYRLNVGMVLCNDQNKLFWGKRAAKSNGWQFPQGGVKENELPIDAMYREISEELGLGPNDLDIIGETKEWHTYDLPEQYRRYYSKPLCIGQKQRWYLLRLVGPESCIRLDATRHPEFTEYKWVDFWYAVDHIIDFKQDIYRTMLTEFEPLLLGSKETS